MELNEIGRQIIQADIKAGIIPFLLGPGGIGKTDTLKRIAKANHTECFVVACNQMADRTDLLGVRQGKLPDGTAVQEFYPMRTIQEAIDYAEAHPTSIAILFLDELNRAPADVISGLLAMSSEKRIADREIPQNLAIVVAGNDKGHVVQLDAPSVSRYHLMRVRPHTATFLAYNEKTLNPYVKTVLENDPDLIFCEPRHVADADDDSTIDIEDELDMEEGMNPYTCPRSISMLSRTMNQMGDDMLRTLMTTPSDEGSDTLLEEMMKGLVGETDFMRKLNVEVTKGLNSAAASTARYQVPKPMVWETLVAQTTQDALEDYVNHTLSTEDVAGCFVYALADGEDRTDVIYALAHRLDEECARTGGNLDAVLAASDRRTLVELASNDMLNVANIEAFRKTDSALWPPLKAVFSFYLD